MVRQADGREIPCSVMADTVRPTVAPRPEVPSPAGLG
jgi:hypothetical protein